MHVQFRVSEYHHFGRIVDTRGDLPRLSALLAPCRPLPLLQSALIGHYIALARHPGIAPVRNSKLFLFTFFFFLFYCGDSDRFGGSHRVALLSFRCAPLTPPPQPYRHRLFLFFCFFIASCVPHPSGIFYFYLTIFFCVFLTFVSYITADRIL